MPEQWFVIVLIGKLLSSSKKSASGESSLYTSAFGRAEVLVSSS